MDFTDLLFPKYCLECRNKGRYICDICVSKVRKAKLICPECKLYNYDGFAHKECLKNFGLNRFISIWGYEGVIRKSILALKYKFASAVAEELSVLAASELVNYKLNSGKYILTPIPLHRKRENWRGFNQSAEISKIIAIKLGWRYEENLLRRLENTTPQVHLKRQQRLQNIRGKYAVNNADSLVSTVDGKTIVLFDDVWTTGATIFEACKALKKTGAKKVWGLALARS